jgi:hypothetical protein
VLKQRAELALFWSSASKRHNDVRRMRARTFMRPRCVRRARAVIWEPQRPAHSRRSPWRSNQPGPAAILCQVRDDVMLVGCPAPFRVAVQGRPGRKQLADRGGVAMVALTDHGISLTAPTLSDRLLLG